MQWFTSGNSGNSSIYFLDFSSTPALPGTHEVYLSAIENPGCFSQNRMSLAPEPNASHPSFARMPTAPREPPSLDGLPTVQAMFHRPSHPRDVPSEYDRHPYSQLPCFRCVYGIAHTGAKFSCCDILCRNFPTVDFGHCRSPGLACFQATDMDRQSTTVFYHFHSNSEGDGYKCF